MFLRLLLMECKQWLKSTTYYIFVICIVLFYISQMGELAIIEKPQPGQEDYGMKYSEDDQKIMESTMSALMIEAAQNHYITYPIGFYKTVKLSDKEQKEMYEIISEVTGLSQEEIKDKVINYLSDNMMDFNSFPVTLVEGMTYERFEILMEQADQLLGGGSSYSKAFIKSNARVPKTYEDALEEYNDIIKNDRLTGAYARVFCDYLGIVLGILPIFIAVTRGLRDRRAKASEVIHSHSMSSLSIVASRYLGMILMMILPVFIISSLPFFECVYYGNSMGITVDYLAFAKYILGWLLPTLLVTTSLGVFLTELTGSAIAIIVQGIWWFISLFAGVINISGGYGWNLMPRHNTVGYYQIYHENFHILAMNRMFYTVIALVILLVSVMIFELNRRGRLNVRGTILPNRKKKYKN